MRTGLPGRSISRFGWLMEVYGENFSRLARLFHPETLPVGRYVSAGDDGLDVMLDVLVHHAYTVELRLSYRMADPETGLPDPSAHVRFYRDARQAEASHCYVGRRWQDVLGLHPAPRVLLGHRLRMNAFLNKWLEYLQGQGHGPHRLGRVRTHPRAGEEGERVTECA